MQRLNRWLSVWWVLLMMGAIIHAQERITLTVFAAASLTDALTEVEAIFEEQYPNVDVVFQFGGSSTLATQIQEGAAVDVFASANLAQMNKVVEAELVDEAQVQVFVRNTLVVIVPADNPATIESPADLAKAGVLLVVASPDVPIRQYTDELLVNMAGEYGADYADAVLANIASEEENVRQIVAKIALGEGDAGVVYQSDVTPDVAEAIQVIAVPDGTSPLAEYPIAPLINAPQPEWAQTFVDFVLSEDGQAILVKWGFLSVLEPEVEATPEVTPEATPQS